MPETIRGRAIFWGVGSSFVASGFTLTGGVTTVTTPGTGVTFAAQSVETSVEARIRVGVADNTGLRVAEAFADQMQGMKFTVIPTADTIAHVKDGAYLPRPGTTVTIVDTDDDQSAGNNSGRYTFIRGTRKRSNVNPVELDFELEQNVDNDIANTVSA